MTRLLFTAAQKAAWSLVGLQNLFHSSLLIALGSGSCFSDFWKMVVHEFGIAWICIVSVTVWKLPFSYIQNEAKSA